MAFISCAYIRYDPATDQYLYTLVDSDFGEVNVVGGTGIVREYIKRGFSIDQVGRNVAIFILFLHKLAGNSVADLCYLQDKNNGKRIENWEMYANERDKHLSKLLALV